MSTRLVILGLLKDKPLYGYELKRIIEQNMGDWTSIAFGSIYFALSKLKDEGLVEIESEERVGNRPSRSVYKITQNGRNSFLSLLRDNWRSYNREYYPIDIALIFSGELPADEVREYIKKRIGMMEKAMEYLALHKKSKLSRPGVPMMAKAVFSHSEFHIRAELEWLRSVLEEVTKTVDC
jgi:DNA-binding PadR family transcriptional regulator